MPFQSEQFPTVTCVPDPHGRIPPGGQALPVRTENNGLDWPGVPPESEESLAPRRIPDVNDGIPVGGSQALPVRAEGHAPDVLDVPFHGQYGQQFLAVARVPDSEGPTPA